MIDCSIIIVSYNTEALTLQCLDSIFRYSYEPYTIEVIVVDNATTAMTGQQEHPGTGKKLDHTPTSRVIIENVEKGIGVENVATFNLIKEKDAFVSYLKEKMASNETTLIVLRQPCILAMAQIAKKKA